MPALAAQQAQAPLYDKYPEDVLVMIGVSLRPVNPFECESRGPCTDGRERCSLGLPGLLLDIGVNLVITSSAALLLAKGVAGLALGCSGWGRPECFTRGVRRQNIHLQWSGFLRGA